MDCVQRIDQPAGLDMIMDKVFPAKRNTLPENGGLDRAERVREDEILGEAGDGDGMVEQPVTPAEPNAMPFLEMQKPVIQQIGGHIDRAVLPEIVGVANRDDFFRHEMPRMDARPFAGAEAR